MAYLHARLKIPEGEFRYLVSGFYRHSRLVQRVAHRAGAEVHHLGIAAGLHRYGVCPGYLYGFAVGKLRVLRYRQCVVLVQLRAYCREELAGIGPPRKVLVSAAAVLQIYIKPSVREHERPCEKGPRCQYRGNKADICPAEAGAARASRLALLRTFPAPRKQCRYGFFLFPSNHGVPFHLVYFINTSRCCQIYLCKLLLSAVYI